MLIVRSPLRVSLGGGGTDLPSYYSEHGGHLLAAAINKYVYVSVMRPFAEGIYLKYSQIENCSSIDQVKHPIIKASLESFSKENNQIEIVTLADIPAGTGLGSSGSFATALIKALQLYDHKHISASDLAEKACHIEIDILKEPIGKQDQYIAAFGGLSSFSFEPNGKVSVSPVNIQKSDLWDLEENLLLFFTGYSRKASDILGDQNLKTVACDQVMLENLHYVKEIGFRSMAALESGDLSKFGELMHEHWLHKRKRTDGMSNQNINKWYEKAIKNGAIGGKLVGAGGGGFLMFLASDKKSLRKAMKEEGLEEVRFGFDFDGTRAISQ